MFNCFMKNEKEIIEKVKLDRKSCFREFMYTVYICSDVYPRIMKLIWFK